MIYWRSHTILWSQKVYDICQITTGLLDNLIRWRFYNLGRWILRRSIGYSLRARTLPQNLPTRKVLVTTGVQLTDFLES